MKEHGLLLFLAPELQLAHAALQVQKRLGRSYAGLLAITEGYHSLGVLSDDDYKMLVEKYSKGLEKTKPVQTVRRDAAADAMSRKFSMVLDQWQSHPQAKWRNYWISEAEQWKDRCPNAKLVLDLRSASP